MKTILIADDDPHIRDVIEFALDKAGYRTAMAKDGAEAIEAFEKHMPDLIVLDVGMPEHDGLEVCRRIRQKSQVPILFLSARDDEIDRIVGLEIGGDDYVTKPFSTRELVARVGNILRRSNYANLDAIKETAFEYGLLSLDAERRQVDVDGLRVTLTGTEFDILHLLIRRPGIVFNRETILEQAWQDNIHVSDRTIDSHMRNLRAKLRGAGCPDAIRTVHGVGFQLDRCMGEG